VIAYPCSRHPDREADLVCMRCTGWFCPACVKPIEGARARGCIACNGILRPLTKAVAVDTPRQMLGRLFSSEGLLMIAVLSLVTLPTHLGGLFAPFFFVVWIGVLGGYCLQTIDHMAAGQAGLPFTPELIELWEIVKKAIRGVLLFALAFGPALAASAMAPEDYFFQLAMLILGGALAPASLLAGVITRNGINQLWPVAWVQVIARAPKGYLALLPWVFGSLLSWAGTTLFFSWLFDPIAAVWSILSPVLHTTFALGLACVFGRYLQREGPSFGI
jgi:hypothetical protein